MSVAIVKGELLFISAVVINFPTKYLFVAMPKIQKLKKKPRNNGD